MRTKQFNNLTITIIIELRICVYHFDVFWCVVSVWSMWWWWFGRWQVVKPFCKVQLPTDRLVGSACVPGDFQHSSSAKLFERVYCAFISFPQGPAFWPIWKTWRPLFLQASYLYAWWRLQIYHCWLSFDFWGASSRVGGQSQSTQIYKLIHQLNWHVLLFSSSNISVSSSMDSAKRVVSSAYVKLLILLPPMDMLP